LIPEKNKIANSERVIKMYKTIYIEHAFMESIVEQQIPRKRNPVCEIVE
jgi:hypothetical protein